MKALEIDRVSHRFGARTVLSEVSFEVAAGGFAVLLGRNGAGKTTLMSLIARLYHPRTGEIRVFGASLRARPIVALSRLGVVFQLPTLDVHLSVRENMRYQAALYGLSRPKAEESGRVELSRFGLLDRLDDPVRALSNGLRRQAEIARALLHQPQLLLLDEPTVGLDLPARRAILAHVRALCRERGIAALWATHLMDEVEDDDALVLLHEGKMLHAGPARELAGRTLAGSLSDAFLTLTREAA